MILSVGGGGLMCGVLQGMHDVGWKDVPLVAMETKGANSLASSLDAGEVVTLSGITRFVPLVVVVCFESHKKEVDMMLKDLQTRNR